MNDSFGYLLTSNLVLLSDSQNPLNGDCKTTTALSFSLFNGSLMQRKSGFRLEEKGTEDLKGIQGFFSLLHFTGVSFSVTAGINFFLLRDKIHLTRKSQSVKTIQALKSTQVQRVKFYLHSQLFLLSIKPKK